MNPSIPWLLIFFAVVLAIVIDLYLMKWMRMRILKRHKDNPEQPEGVYIFGAYSPIFTWLRRFWKALPYSQSDTSLQDIQKGDNLPEANLKSEGILSNLQKILVWFECRGEGFRVLILMVGILFFCRGILSLRMDLQLPGVESEYFQYVIQFFVQSLLQDRQFPTWNPYLHTGLPFLADPMLHIYNPFVTLPCLLFGVRIGYRVALVLSYILAAIGMMKLGKASGFGNLVSLWLGFMYAFAGQPTARFFQGQYLFIFGFAWIPWVFYFLLRYSQTRDVKKLVYFAFAFALLYFSGNAYYTFILFWLILIFIFLFTFKVFRRPFSLKMDHQFLIPVLVALAIWCGMIALHFVPMLQFRPYMSKGQDILGSHTPLQIWLDYTSKDTHRDDAYSALPAREEFYAYIGYMPFVAMLLLPFSWQRGKRNWIFYWIAVLIFVVLWVNVDRMPWRNYYYSISFFSQFRHVLRPLIFGSLALLILGAFGLDTTWRRLATIIESGQGQKRNRLISVLSGVGLWSLVVLMAWGLFDTFRTNSEHIFLQDDSLHSYRVVNWLKNYDPSNYYVRHNPVNEWHLAMLNSRMKFIDAWYHWTDIRRIDSDQLNQRQIQAQPNYLIQAVDEPVPEGDWRLIHQMDGNAIYEMLDSLPIAFKTSLQTLGVNSNEELKREEVEALIPLFINTNAIEVIAQGTEKDVLVVLVTNYPGWRVKVDDRNAKLESTSGYLAVKMQDGVHKYRFEFHPTAFYWGSIISLISLGIGLFVICSDLIAVVRWLQHIMIKGKDTWEAIKNIRVGWSKQKPVFNSAVFQQGMFLPKDRLALEEGYEVDLVVIPRQNNENILPSIWNVWKQMTLLLVRVSIGAITFTTILFGLGILIYFGSRMIRLSDFPIYFFTDEAIQTASAADLVRDGFYGAEKVFLPTYFPNGSYWNLSLSVYVQVLPYLLFGKSVFVTRFTSLFLSGLMVLVLIEALRKTVCRRAWWSFLLFLAVTPTWFLHSRTAFETVLFSGFYAAFLGAYLLYIQRSPRYLYLAIFMAALAFYTYSPGQVVIAVSAIALFVVDFRYHWQNRASLGKGFLFILLLAIPYLRFMSYHHEAPFQQLRNLDSYWFYDLPLIDKILRYFKEYLMGLNPYYWFIPHSIDLNRHTMKGYGHLGLWNLPFIVLGLIYVLRQWRKPPYRVFLIAWLAVPCGAALVGVGITRLLAMVIPMAIFATLGWEWILSRINQPRWQKVAQVILFVVLSGVAFSMTSDSLRNGPTWYEDYGLYGMQYGTRQLFEQKIPEYLQRDPQNRLFVSSLWANGADVFVRYFLTPEQARRVNLGSIDSYLSRKKPLDEQTVFFLTVEELRAALASPKMRFLRIEEEIPYPNGKTGFYIVRLVYVDNVDEIFIRELELRRQLMDAFVVVDGISAKVRYSQIDDGELGNLFDQKPHTLMRGREANPFILQFEFAQPQSLKGLQAQFGSMSFELVVYLYPDGQMQPIELRQEYRGLPPDPFIELLFPEEYLLSKLRIEIRNLDSGDFANIHIRELKFLK